RSHPRDRARCRAALPRQDANARRRELCRSRRTPRLDEWGAQPGSCTGRQGPAPPPARGSHRRHRLPASERDPANLLPAAHSTIPMPLRGIVLGLLCLAAKQGRAQEPESPSLPEYVLKAGFLYNFAKYVEWPPDAFATPDAPISIGVVGTDPF